MSLQYSFHALDDLDRRYTLRYQTTFECFNARHPSPARVSMDVVALPSTVASSTKSGSHRRPRYPDSPR